MTTDHDPVERVLEVFVYAPLGLGLWLRDLAPSVLDTVVSRGRAEVDRRHEQAQQRITTARSMGEVALAFGVPKLRSRAGRQVSAVRAQADRLVDNITATAGRSNGAATGTTAGAPPSRHAPTTDAQPVPVVDDVPATEHRSESSAHLPIPGYDALSASQVVERLAGLGAEELTAVREYEITNRNRRTILGKIDQLTVS